MVQSGTYLKDTDAQSRYLRLLFAFWLVVWVAVPRNAFAQTVDLASQSLNKPLREFLVSTTAPYSLPFHFDASNASLSAIKVGQLAAERCGPANLVASDSKSRAIQPHSVRTEREYEKDVLRLFQSAVACRLKQTASANAMKLHFGIAACLVAEQTLSETAELLAIQEQAQAALVDKGIPISDPLLVQRLKIILEDKHLDNQSKAALLRTQLATLIGTENACRHSPVEPREIVPSDHDVCEHVQQALRCRCDLQSMIRLRRSINADTLAVWDGIGALISGVPTLTKHKPFWSKILRTKRTQAEIQCAIKTRQSWLDDLIAERTKQIAMEVEIAFEKKKTAALRWVKSGEQIANWDTRIEQLERLSEAQGNLASQYEAKLNRLQAEGQRTQLWAEWHLANEDLKLGIGRDL